MCFSQRKYRIDLYGARKENGLRRDVPSTFMFPSTISPEVGGVSNFIVKF